MPQSALAQVFFKSLDVVHIGQPPGVPSGIEMGI